MYLWYQPHPCLQTRPWRTRLMLPGTPLQGLLQLDLELQLGLGLGVRLEEVPELDSGLFEVFDL